MKARSDNDDPMVVAPAILVSLPILTFLVTEQPEPIRTKCLIEMLDPKCAKSKTDIDEPIRANERNDKLDAMLIFWITLTAKILPIEVTPLMERPEPHLINALTLKLDAIFMPS
jgi:hypothetical protein